MSPNESADRRAAITIEPPTGWQSIDLRELRDYRDLFLFLVWRNIKVLYAQTVLGAGWALLNPLLQIIIFTIIFGRVAAIDTGDIPYVLFSTVAVIPWTYMSEAMTQSSQSLVAGQGMLGKIYFPRLLFPITPVLAKLLDFAISLLLLLAVLITYQVVPGQGLLLLPLLLPLMIMIPMGLGMWLSALAIRFRDVKFALPFGVRMLIYAAPVLYPASAIPSHWQLLYALNPMVGVIEGFRAALLNLPPPWWALLPALVTGPLLLLSGAHYFRRMERVFADVI